MKMGCKLYCIPHTNSNLRVLEVSVACKIIVSRKTIKQYMYDLDEGKYSCKHAPKY